LPAPPAQADPLVVSVTVPREEESAAIGRLNAAMQGHPLLNSQRFSEKVREISGSMTADELHVLFDRIRGAGKVSYKRSRLTTAGTGERISFVMRLRTAAKQPMPAQPADAPAGAQPEKAADAAAEKSGEGRAGAAPGAAEPAPAQQ
jgi:hypothetical protein